ncbi:MAG: glycoside hydrolase domain-containing protein [Kiritimatiellia bacterium]
MKTTRVPSCKQIVVIAKTCGITQTNALVDAGRYVSVLFEKRRVKGALLMRGLHFLTLVLYSILLTAPVWSVARPVIGLTALHSMERIFQYEAPFGTPTAEITAARNEVESFQVVVAAGKGNLKVNSVVLSELVGEGGAKISGNSIKLYREEYVRVRKSTFRSEMQPGLYPDALIPFIDPVSGKPIQTRSRRRERPGGPMITIGHDMYAVPFEVFEGQNQPVWIDIHVPKGVPAGIYRGTLRVSADRGKAELPITLTVWDFDLPDGPTHSNNFGGFSGVASLFGVKHGSDEFREIEARYCQAMTEHRLNPPLPSHLLPQVNSDGSLTIDTNRHAALRTFIEKLHVKDFRIPSSPFGRLPSSTTDANYKTIPPEQRKKALRYYRDYYQYVKSNGWADRAYVELIDEPNTAENYEQELVIAAVVHEAAPELKCLVCEQTYPHDPTWVDIDPAVDIWCPLWSFIDRDTINQKLKQGDAVWSYTALAQRSPTYHPKYKEVGEKDPPYWHIDQPLLAYRVPTWINRQYGITGLIYWSTITEVIDPWYSPVMPRTLHFNGGGHLFYPGVPCGIQGPVASMRLKNIRDSMEDYEYFALLEQRAGAAAVQKIVDRIAPTWWGYTRDPKAIFDARRELATAILAH